MINIYFDTYILLVIFLVGLGAGGIIVGINESWDVALGTGILFLLLTGLLTVVTPTMEQMISKEYEDVLASRPACATVIDKNIDAASLECLREYKKYLKDSVDAATQYFEHFSRLKAGLHY